MEQAMRVYPDEPREVALDPPMPRGTSEGPAEGIEKVLRFAPARAGEDESGKPPPVSARDFASAMDLVRDAAGRIKAAEERSREADGRTHTIAQRAAEELKNAELRIQALETRARMAEGRAADAEARATEADAWLRQIFSTIADELPLRRT